MQLDSEDSPSNDRWATLSTNFFFAHALHGSPAAARAAARQAANHLPGLFSNEAEARETMRRSLDLASRLSSRMEEQARVVTPMLNAVINADGILVGGRSTTAAMALDPMGNLLPEAAAA